MRILSTLFLVVPDTNFYDVLQKLVRMYVLKFSRKFALPAYTQHKISTLKMPFFFLSNPFFPSTCSRLLSVSVCSLSSIIFSLLPHSFSHFLPRISLRNQFLLGSDKVKFSIPDSSQALGIVLHN